MIEIPKRSQTGKNSADIRLVVDAMDLAWSKTHVDTFVIVSGDSDFSPLVSKLKENGKHVIGLGMKGSTSDLLRDNCDEFIYYEDLERQEQNEQQLATDLNTYLPPNLPERQRELYSLLIEACHALRRENHEVIYASMIKDTMKRKKPSFDESYYGYRSFTHLLEDADNLALVDIERNPKSGTYVVTGFSGERDRKAHRAEPGANNTAAAAGRRSGRETRRPARPRRCLAAGARERPSRVGDHQTRLRSSLTELHPAGETAMFLDRELHRTGSESPPLAEHSVTCLRPCRPAITLAVLSVCVIGLPGSASDEPQNETLAKHKLKALGSLQVLEDEAEFKTKLTEARRLLRQLSYSVLQQQGTMSPEQYQKTLQGMKDELNQMRSQINQASQQMSRLPRFRGRLASSYAQEQYNELHGLSKSAPDAGQPGIGLAESASEPESRPQSKGEDRRRGERSARRLPPGASGPAHAGRLGHTEVRRSCTRIPTSRRPSSALGKGKREKPKLGPSHDFLNNVKLLEKLEKAESAG